jgi:hypothetical protein
MTAIDLILNCSIPGCERPPHARGWCSRHYDRWRHHGDPLKGGTMDGEPLDYLTRVVLPYDGDECLIWSYGRNSAGYAFMRIDGRQQSLTRRVCASIHGPPPSLSHQAAHRCGRGHDGCVTPKHLRWASPAENVADTLVHGTRARGTRHGMAKLIPADVRQIMALKGQLSQQAIADQFGVTRCPIRRIHQGTAWAWLDPNHEPARTVPCLRDDDTPPEEAA